MVKKSHHAKSGSKKPARKHHRKPSKYNIAFGKLRHQHPEWSVARCHAYLRAHGFASKKKTAKRSAKKGVKRPAKKGVKRHAKKGVKRHAKKSTRRHAKKGAKRHTKKSAKR